MPEDKDFNFPDDFLWGASTASHQVEGGTLNQWTVWELASASHLAKTAHKKLGHLPNWPQVRIAAEKPSNYVSANGVKHFQLYKQDFDILAKLNFNAFRFGIEWSRIEPYQGQWNDEAIKHYGEYIHELKQRNIEPVLNLWHWTHPTWFEDRGGFAKRSNLKYFYRFAQKIADEFGKDLSYVITLNEPNVYATFSYLKGEWPPNQKSHLATIAVYLNFISAHKKTYKIFKRNHKSLQVGVAAQLANIQAKRPHNILDVTATKIMRAVWNWWFLKRIRNYQDFVGINYYFSDYYKGFRVDNPKLPLSDVGWYMEPEGLYPLLLRAWAHFKKPIIITENGVADENDQYRQWWIQETIIAMERALSEGVKLKGYFHWSLLDNFEWAYGWWPKFGLVEVDRQNGMKRKIRPSALWFASQIKQKLSKNKTL